MTEMAIFVAAVDQGSLAGAARLLRRSPPTVTRVIGDLERRLGVRLLDRTTRRCSPTEAGRRFADDARHMLLAYDEAVSAASGEMIAPRGALKMTAPIVFGREHVAPAIGAFLDAQPGINVQLDLSDRQHDLVEDGYDAALRIGRIRDGSLVARRLGTVQRVVVASPAYLERRGVPDSPADIPAHAIIQHGSNVDTPWAFRGSADAPLSVRVRPRFTVNQADAALAAARADRGLVTALSYQVHEDLAAGRLVRLLQRFEPEPLPVHLVWPEGRQQLRRLRLLIDHLVPWLSQLPVLRPA